MSLGAEFRLVLEAAQAGEKWAIERLYLDLSPRVLKYLRRLRAREPEDVTSEVFVGVMQGLPKFQGNEEDFRSWVFAIAYRRSMDEKRRLARRPEDSVDPTVYSPLVTKVGGNTEAEALAEIGFESIIQLFPLLTGDQQAVVWMRVVGDFSVRETASRLKKTGDAIKQLQRRALAALARHMEPRWTVT